MSFKSTLLFIFYEMHRVFSDLNGTRIEQSARIEQSRMDSVIFFRMKIYDEVNAYKLLVI